MKHHAFASAAGALAITIACWINPVLAQSGAWPVQVLQPPGVDTPHSFPDDVDVAGDFAVTVYGGQPNRIHVQQRIPAGWLPAQLLAEGKSTDGSASVDADADHIATGWSAAADGGRVDLYARTVGGNGWHLEQSLVPPTGATDFGIEVSVAGDILAVMSNSVSGGSRMDSFVRDAKSGSWTQSDYSETQDGGSQRLIAATDGRRIATCSGSRCWTRLRIEDGQWIDEASTTADVDATQVDIDGEWMFASDSTLGIYKRVGASWQQQQQIEDAGTFAAREETLLVHFPHIPNAAMAIYSPDPGGTWQALVEAPIDGHLGRLAGLGSDIAVIGVQSFRRNGVAWVAAGTVGLPRSISGARYGQAVAMAHGSAWIGSPGFASPDLGSGAVFREPLEGLGQPARQLSPAAPALWLGHGEAIASDSERTVVVSRSPRPLGDDEMRLAVYSNWQVDPTIREITLPVAQGFVVAVDVALDLWTIAVTRRIWTGTSHQAEVLVYDAFATLVLEQVIPLPGGTYYPDRGYGNNVELYEDWLLAGTRQYRRVDGGPFESVRDLSYPLNAIPDGRLIASGASVVAVPAWDDVGTGIGLVFTFSPSDGWTFSRSMRNYGDPIADGCKALAVAATRIACLGVGANGAELLIATRGTSGGDWVVGSRGAVPGPAAGWGSAFKLAMAGERVLVGWPATGYAPTGTDAGRVVVMTLSERIFAAGFEQP